jgi:hypothetical protein
MIALADVLANRAWLRREHPFPHIVARDVFTAEFYGALAAQMRGVLARGLSETPAPDRFSRNIPGYDSYGIGFDASIGGPAAVFLSPAWRDLMCGLFDVGTTPYVFAGSHHHGVGSASGFIHNDFNSVWFRRCAADRIQVPSNDVCSYTRGIGSLAAEEKIEVVRGAVVLFFLLNDGWRPGDGGAIGLFASRTDSVEEPAVSCPPINNSLVVFECTPRSFHAFMTNRRLLRTSIIMWVHRPLAEAVERFGADRLEQWER